jgi:DNA-binding beta-propeller fold protein YncE
MRRRAIAVVAMLAFAVVLVSDAFGATAQLSGSVSAGGTPDTTKITVTSPGTISATIQWSTPSAVLTLALVDPNLNTVKTDTSTNNPKTITWNATITGTYKVIVKAKSGSSSFTGSVSFPGVSVPTYAGQVGGGTAGHAEIYPSGLDVGPDGTVYVADTGNDQVKAYNAMGGVLWTRGSRGVRTVGNFSNPRDIAYLGGKLYVDDTGNNRVQVLNASDGSVFSSTAWPLGTSSLGITAGKDASGNNIILVSEDTQNRIAIFDTSGTLLCTLAVPQAGSPLKAAQPRDAATNAAGNIYVAAYQQDQIDEFGAVHGTTCPSSTPIRTWGGHGTDNTHLIRPYGVAVDAGGNVYVADSDNERIQEFSSTGTYIATYGGNTNAGGTFSQLRRVALNPTTGDVYGADLWDFHIDRFTDPTLTPVKPIYGGVLPQPGFFNEPSGITFDSSTGSGKLYVADSVNQRMQVFSPGANGASWTFTNTFGARGWGNGDLSGFNWPRDISFAPGSGTLWVADTKNNRLLQFTTAGLSAGSSVSIGGALTWPYAVDASTNKLIVADTFANKVESRNPDGSTNWTVTTANGVALKNPYDVTVSGSTVYVADSGNKRIIELDAATGGYVGSIVNSTYIHSPQGVAVDPTSGSIWVADTSYNKVVEFTSTGQFIQAVGAKGSGNKQFNHPAHLDVHVDSTGHAYLYVTDVYNDRIQILDLNEN